MEVGVGAPLPAVKNPPNPIIYSPPGPVPPEVKQLAGPTICVYGADETFHKDCFQIFAAAAHRTSKIVFAPDVTHAHLEDYLIEKLKAAK